MWDTALYVFLLYSLRLNLIVGESLMPNHDLWFTKNQQSYEGV